jgi:hypothetical protein
VLRIKEREVEKVSAETLEDARRMDKRRRNGCRMENGSDPVSTQGGRPKLRQPVNWKLNTAHVTFDIGQREIPEL